MREIENGRDRMQDGQDTRSRQTDRAGRRVQFGKGAGLPVEGGGEVLRRLRDTSQMLLR